ncbi:acyltransferase family protein [Flexithrix dorotheae]|uniref:acyltransferase family protein n=1 Tax=Flexithrix dorotheae TaxID=70993 RepID=UPI00039EA78E|nr:heparan-alpha-glucosaminide N-acetyltransferase domain-containing protein [Flexithrix dorotheae]
MEATKTATNKTQQRLISLDAFRGLTIAGMIIVNTPGSWSNVYPPLLHASWHGVTPTDLVFPFFVFIMGVSITLAFTKQLEVNKPKSEIIKKLVIRSLKIFALGIFLALFPKFDFMNLRIPGVLQRIAICYFACGLLFLHTDWKTQAKIGGITLLLYWAAMMLIPVPGVGIGVLEPGKNLAAYIDSLLVPGRLYQGNWDPEGLLSTFPAIVTGITGMLAGHLIISNMDQNKKIVWLFTFGFLSFILGGIWDWFFPINKNLWSSSYVLYSSGLAGLTLACSIWFVDVLGYKKWTKIGLIFGANAITAYVLSGILYTIFNLFSLRSVFYNGLVDFGMDPKMASLLWALFYAFMCFIPVWILYRKKIYIKL